MDQLTLKALLRYEPDTGNFYWLAGKRAGRLAGFGFTRGRIQICINGKNYYAYRLAWLYVTGCMPKGVIDHKNGNALDNSIDNLRDTTQSGNLQNQRRARSDNVTSGVLGVKGRSNGKWQAAINVNGKNIHLGTFSDVQQASDAYLAEKRKSHAMCTI